MIVGRIPHGSGFGEIFHEKDILHCVVIEELLGEYMRRQHNTSAK